MHEKWSSGDGRKISEKYKCNVYQGGFQLMAGMEAVITMNNATMPPVGIWNTEHS